MDGYWVGVPDQPDLMPVLEAFGDVPDPQTFDRMYLQHMGPNNNLFSMLGELQAYTRQAELEMELYDRRQSDWFIDTRYSLMRTLYQLDIYLGHLHAAHPEQWARLVASPAAPYLVKGLTERAWSVAQDLQRFPKLGYNIEQTEAATNEHTDHVQAFVAAAGVAEPVALDPRSEPLQNYGIYVIGF